MKNLKLLLMIMFSILFAKMMVLSFKNYSMHGLIDALPYAFVGIVFLVIAGYMNKSMRKN